MFYRTCNSRFFLVSSYSVSAVLDGAHFSEIESIRKGRGNTLRWYTVFPPNYFCTIGLTAEHQISNLVVRVRFPHGAPTPFWSCSFYWGIWAFESKTGQYSVPGGFFSIRSCSLQLSWYPLKRSQRWKGWSEFFWSSGWQCPLSGELRTR